MKRLTQTDPFKIVSSESSSASEIREATDELIEMILELSDSATDDTTLFRIMNYTRFILQTLQKKSLCKFFYPTLLFRARASAFH
ncbi:hypothetical protein PGIN_YH522_01132 [Porphyromonas gingivalis]|uniref:Uncharacterized protein n=1 Tax=Porphyromonas cangingivalis TaxID=36874 RepID=A0A1T4LCY2_PORCN|nr:hypothetical protein HMPREF1554_00780 [Porphyromonas gingivalis F0569]ERJ86228.1 hypothetical protein HMPREF1989_01379 [Porphyromonas gingivalis F0566]OWP34527.1 hypothetical protein CBG53_01120 [Porphyromonas gingivalis]OWR79197.1 hypothetical protein SJDPG11_05545 [Porphyromonas gingivalis SJD11]SJZ52374.1 hypothetical protein SAMN02745205_01084 [Porphyromonas cangingivalis]